MSSHLEDQLLAEEFRKALEKSGLSTNAFAIQSGINGAQAHLSYLFSGKRGLSFWKALRIATALGVNLGDVQKKWIEKSSTSK